MAEVLVLAEHSGGEVKKVTGELLTLARQFGEPAAVWIGADSQDGQARLAEYGAVKVYVAEGGDVTGYVTGPEAEVLATLHRFLGEDMRIDVEFQENIDMVRTGKRLATVSKLGIDFQKIQAG